MTAQDMLDNLGLRLEDPDKKAFPDSFRMQSLENSQIVMASLLPNDLLAALQVLDSAEALASSKVLLSALSKDVLKGIMGIVMLKNTSGLWCNPVGLVDLKKTENSFYTPTTQNPMYFNFANTIFPLPSTLTAIDVYFLKVPNPLRHPFTMAADSPASTTQFVVDASQGISAVADTYNGTVIFNITTNKYHVVTDSDADRTFTVSPVRDGATTWSSADTFYFVTHDYFLINLDNVTCELDASYHEIIITLAEVQCWLRKGSLDRANEALSTAYGDIQSIIEQREPITGIGEK